MNDFVQKYGPWALVAGASERLGEAYARTLGARGLNLLLIARRSTVLDRVAGEIRSENNVEVRCLCQDLASAQIGGVVEDAIAGIEVGMVVYNAAFVPTGAFAETDDESIERVVLVNVLGPLIVLRKVLPAMRKRRRGGVVLMSSVAGFQGIPMLSGYAASKSFTTIFGESLWGELRQENVDVVVCCSGAVPTPGYRRSYKQDVPGMLSPETVVEKTLEALGKGPRFVPGFVNGAVSQVFNRILSRKQSISIMQSNTRKNLK